MRTLVTAVAAAVSVLLLIVLLLQVGALHGELDAVSGDAANAASEAASVREELGEIRAAVERLNDELAALPRDGVVPTDSSGLILERMTEIRDDLAALSQRVDDICRNAPIELC